MYLFMYICIHVYVYIYIILVPRREQTRKLQERKKCRVSKTHCKVTREADRKNELHIKYTYKWSRHSLVIESCRTYAFITAHMLISHVHVSKTRSRLCVWINKSCLTYKCCVKSHVSLRYVHIGKTRECHRHLPTCSQRIVKPANT